MSPGAAAATVFWRHKRFWLIQSLALGAWTVLALSWFWLPDSQVWGVALAAAQGLAVLIGAAWLIRKALVFYRREHAGADGRRNRLPHPRLRFALDFAALAVIGVYLPYALIHWRPRLTGLAMQTASLVVRFGAAFFVAVSAWLILLSLLSSVRTGSAATRAESSSEPPAPRIAQPDR